MDRLTHCYQQPWDKRLHVPQVSMDAIGMRRLQVRVGGCHLKAESCKAFVDGRVIKFCQGGVRGAKLPGVLVAVFVLPGFGGFQKVLEWFYCRLPTIHGRCEV